MNKAYASLAAVMLLAGAAVTANAAFPVVGTTVGTQGAVSLPIAHHPKVRLANRLTSGDPVSGLVSTAKDVLPVFGTDVRVSYDNPGRPHNEFFGASDPVNPLHFITGANDYSSTRTSYSGFWYTFDGGLNWNGGQRPGPYPGGTNILPQGDPIGDIDAQGNTYFGDLGFNPTSDCLGGVYLHRSTDGGVSFIQSTMVAASSDTHFLDKPWMAANKQVSGPYAGWLYYSYTDFLIGAGCDFNTYDGSPVKMKYSSNHGATWSGEITLPQPTSPAPASQGTYLAVSGDGGSVYAAYNFWYNGDDQRNYVTRSTDGGRTFSGYHPITTGVLDFTGYQDSTGYQYYKADNAGHGFRHSQYPVIGVNPSNPNIVYAAWNHHQAGWDTTYTAACCGGSTASHTFLAGDIAFARSTDGGNTWSAPVRVNDDALNNAKDQFMPAIAVGPDGTIHLRWLDRRDSPDNTLYHTYYTQSTDGGLTWSANQRVSDAQSNPAAVLFSDRNAFIGDYEAIAASASRVLPFWIDTRAGTTAGEQRLYTDPGVITVATATSTSTPTITRTPTPTRTPCPTCPTATATPTPCPMTFSDVQPTDWFYEYVRCLYCRGAISGYSDGTFRPYANATRGQMTKIVVVAFGYPLYTPATPTFSDVPPTNAFYRYIETAAHNNIVSGYSDGTFRWYADVTRSQLSKITVIAAGWATINPVNATFTDVPRENPFYTYIETAACHQIVSGYSDGSFRPYLNATRAQISKIVCLAVRNEVPCQ